MICYVPPALTLGRLDPSWILCTITLKSTVLPVSGSVVCGVWHRTHNSTLRRAPPWADSGSWHLLQVSVFTTSRVAPTFEPSGTKVYTLSSNEVPRPNSDRSREE